MRRSVARTRLPPSTLKYPAAPHSDAGTRTAAILPFQNSDSTPHSGGVFKAVCPPDQIPAAQATHGRMLFCANRHLRYAFIEAGWTAARVSSCLNAYYERLKARRGASKAIGAVARRLCEISYACLKHGRMYEERAYRFRPGAEILQEEFGRVALAIR